MRKLILLTSLMTLFVVFTVPALAQDAQPGATTDQYDTTVTSEQAAEVAVKGIIERGEDDDGAAAYEAALNAAREAGADQDTAVVVAAEAVSDVSNDSEMTELPATGGTSVFALGAGLLIAGAGLLTRRLF
ncbi:MAG: LPXTG cell wall anchor domain-containing protein [Rubrobacteraceae bacterium]